MKSIDQLREELARQILDLALEDPNLQLKLDAYKATQKPPERGKQVETSVPDMMSIMRERVRQADGADQ